VGEALNRPRSAGGLRGGLDSEATPPNGPTVVDWAGLCQRARLPTTIKAPCRQHHGGGDCIRTTTATEYCRRQPKTRVIDSHDGRGREESKRTVLTSGHPLDRKEEADNKDGGERTANVEKQSTEHRRDPGQVQNSRRRTKPEEHAYAGCGRGTEKIADTSFDTQVAA